MAVTVDDYEATLNDVTRVLQGIRNRAREVRQSTAESLVAIQAMPTKHAEVFAAINGFSPSTEDAFERLILSKKSRLDAEASQLLGDLLAARQALSALNI